MYDGVAKYKITKTAKTPKPTTSFKHYAKILYDNYHTDKDIVTSIFAKFPNIEQYVNELGVDALRSCGFQESKIKRKFMQVIGAKDLESNRTSVRSVLLLKKNCWYSLKQVKGLLAKAYTKLGYSSKAFASDIDKYYVVKRSRRSGVEGVVIICDA